jgi:hypothetical protein
LDRFEEEYAQIAIPVQTTGFFGVKKGVPENGFEAGRIFSPPVLSSQAIRFFVQIRVIQPHLLAIESDLPICSDMESSSCYA